MSREVFCQRIVDNIEDIRAELEPLRRRRDEFKAELANQQSNLDQAIHDASEPSFGVGRLPRRRNPVGIGVDVLSAIGEVLTDDSVEEIRRLRSRIEELSREIDRIDDQIGQKESLLQEQHSAFNQNACYDLGFSHEVLNVR